MHAIRTKEIGLADSAMELNLCSLGRPGVGPFGRWEETNAEHGWEKRTAPRTAQLMEVHGKTS